MSTFIQMKVHTCSHSGLTFTVIICVLTVSNIWNELFEGLGNLRSIMLFSVVMTTFDNGYITCFRLK